MQLFSRLIRCFLLSTALLLACSAVVAAQDIIVKADGNEIPCKVIELDPPKVKYLPSDHTDGPIRSLSYAEVFMIKYGNGTKEVLKATAATTTTETTTAKIIEPEELYAIRPWSIGVHGITVASFQFLVGLGGSASYTFSPLPFRLQIDGGAATSVGAFSSVLLMANLSLQYAIPLAGGAVEVAPELGLGALYQTSGGYTSGTYSSALLGVALDFRLKEWLSFRVNPRLRTNFGGNGGSSFEGNIGVRFLFGKYKK